MKGIKMTTTVVICALLAGAAATFTAGTYFGRSTVKVKSLVQERNEWIDTARKYKKIASTHEFEIKKTESSRWTEESYLTYDSSIDKNFERLARDLNKYGDEELIIRVEVWTVGEWSRWLSGKRSEWTGDSKMYTPAPTWAYKEGTLEWSLFGRVSEEYRGPAEDVIDEFRTVVKNPQWGFWVGGAANNNTDWGWARPKAAIRFKVKVFLKDLEPKEPEVIFVEVAVKEPSEDLSRESLKEIRRALGNQGMETR